MDFNSNVTKAIKTLKMPVIGMPIMPMTHNTDNVIEVPVTENRKINIEITY